MLTLVAMLTLLAMHPSPPFGKKTKKLIQSGGRMFPFENSWQHRSHRANLAAHAFVHIYPVRFSNKEVADMSILGRILFTNEVETSLSLTITLYGQHSYALFFPPSDAATPCK